MAYTAEGFIYVLHALTNHGWWASQDSVLYILASVLVWGCIYCMLYESKNPVWSPYVGSWVLGLVLEVVVCGLSIAANPPTNDFENIQLALQTIRIAFLIVLSTNGILLVFPPAKPAPQGDAERQPLLNGNGTADGTDSETLYGTTPATSKNASDDEDEDEPEDRNKKIKEQQRKRLEEQGGWLGYLKGFLIFLPYVWPSKNRRMQLYICIIAFCILAERALNVLIPQQLGIIVNKLTDTEGTGEMPWKEIGLLMFYKFLLSRACLDSLQSMLSSRLTYWSFLRLTKVAFAHVMGLSMEFHDNKDSGELIKSVDQASCLNSLVELVLFQTGPVVIDLWVAMAYVTYLFDIYFAFILVTIGVVYTFVTYKFTNWTSKMRRVYTEKSRNESKVLYENVSNWQTISYFNQFDYESDRLAKACSEQAMTGQKYNDLSNFMFGTQEVVMLFGQLSISFLAAYRVSQGDRPVGNFVALSSYWATLSYPLHMLAYSYKKLTIDLIDSERLLQLLNTKSKVVERDGAPDLKINGGRVAFNEVSFAYDERKTTIKDLTFVAEPGQTVALVGETGSGKSTTLKLLFRFYDISGGSITIDGQDIRDVTLGSLRDGLGVVPQDPSLFNISILENVRYARLDATDEEVYEACKAASIHEKILTFPDGYKTKVGERGVKLSGGELQRVSIARVFLKNPKIVLLDEATSAIDSSTESQIQESFRKLSTGRTTFIIAHRLSTIMDADCILVVDKGEIVERGTHQELLDLGGNYVNLWNKQSAKKNKSGGSSVTEAGEQEVLIPDLLESTLPPQAATLDGVTDGSSLLDQDVNECIDQLDGHSGSKQMLGSNPRHKTEKPSSIKSCFKDDELSSDDDADDETGAAGDAAILNAPLTELTPRPTETALPSIAKVSKGKGKKVESAERKDGPSADKKP
ncbi:uncharacterized protein BDZ99DRAFT_467954 [Mytilinidion resinicola]|uniref:Heavy metal tolerance protein n=1 Tax=Mytilinidion resinicola TaxID=574789 RepID=A0A6A6Y5A6_9PEZI|nr:uncharacterized protein BDZ99DRAFT_467954 [Mytilinidion resinicola]KAF2803840.1 hypothetical protein BDZ99DRAFT_467954 [Mytilinidion resinicola]